MRCFFRRGRLFWRAYLYGILILVSTAVLIGTLAYTHRNQSPWMALAQTAAADIQTAAPDAVQARLVSLARLMQSDMAVYTHRGVMLSSTGPDAPKKLPFEKLSQLATMVHSGASHAVRLSNSTYLMIHYRGHPTGSQVILFGLGLLILLAGLSWPLARALTRPLEIIAATAQAIGAGDLEARTGISQKGEVGTLAHTVDEMAARLARLRAHEKALLANVSHELRTPLARIRVGLEWAEEEGELPTPLAGLGIDLAELESLVGDVLAAARLDPEEGDFVLHPVEVSVAALVEAASAAFVRRHPDRTLICEAGAGSVQGEARLLGRVLSNLLDNAVQYSDKPLVLVVSPGEQGPRFTVLDQGIGVAAADVPHLFDPFFRTDRSRDRATGGTGLGLTLCKRIVEAHGGTIGAIRRTGGGMEFWFEV